MNDNRARPQDAVPEVLPDRDEFARAELAAYWIQTIDRPAPATPPMTIDVCTRAIRLPDLDHEAKAGNRLRIRVASTTRQVFVAEEPDTGHAFVWPAFPPRSPAPIASAPVAVADGVPITTLAATVTETLPSSADGSCRIAREDQARSRVERLHLAESVLRALVLMATAGLPEDRGATFLLRVHDLPRILASLDAWGMFYGGKRIDPASLTAAIGELGVDSGELAMVGAVAGLSRWCDEPTLRCAVDNLADVESWLAMADGSRQ